MEANIKLGKQRQFLLLSFISAVVSKLLRIVLPSVQITAFPRDSLFNNKHLTLPIDREKNDEYRKTDEDGADGTACRRRGEPDAGDGVRGPGDP